MSIKTNDKPKIGGDKGIRGKDNPKPFVKGQSGNPNGRPKKIETLIKDYYLINENLKLSKSQIHDIMISILARSEAELKELQLDKDAPMFMKILAKKSVKDFKNSSMDIVDKVLDRVHGMPGNSIDLAANIQKSNIESNLTLEQKQQILNEVNKIVKK